MTVNDLIEELVELQKDGKGEQQVVVNRHWWSDGDYDYGDNEAIYDDISIDTVTDNQKIQLRIYGEYCG